MLEQPGRPIAEAHELELRRKAATLVTASDLRSWEVREVAFGDGTAGSVAAVLERASGLALDHYQFPDEDDSMFEAVLIDASAALAGTASPRSWSQPVDHGGITAAASGPGGDLVVIEDRHGTRCLDQAGRTVFDFDDGYAYAVQPLAGEHPGAVAVGVDTHDGRTEIRFFRDGRQYAPAVAGLLATHQATPDVTLAAPAGKLAAVFSGDA